MPILFLQLAGHHPSLSPPRNYMIVKKTKQLGNFKKGINLYVPIKRIVSAAPAGIVVDGANTINLSIAGRTGDTPRALTRQPANDTITVGNFDGDGNYYEDNFPVGPNRNYEGAYTVNNIYRTTELIAPNNKSGLNSEIGTQSSWVLYENIYNILGTRALFTNPSTDPTTIPTTDWSPAITITAA